MDDVVFETNIRCFHPNDISKSGVGSCTSESIHANILCGRKYADLSGIIQRLCSSHFSECEEELGLLGKFLQSTQDALFVGEHIQSVNDEQDLGETIDLGANCILVCLGRSTSLFQGLRIVQRRCCV